MLVKHCLASLYLSNCYSLRMHCSLCLLHRLVSLYLSNCYSSQMRKNLCLLHYLASLCLLNYYSLLNAEKPMLITLLWYLLYLLYLYYNRISSLLILLLYYLFLCGITTSFYRLYILSSIPFIIMHNIIIVTICCYIIVSPYNWSIIRFPIESPFLLTSRLAIDC